MGGCSTLHMPVQLSTADGGGSSRFHITSTLNYQWGGSSTLHITSTLNCWQGEGPPHCTSLQLSTTNGGRVFHSAHVISIFNCQWGLGILHISHPVSHIIWDGVDGYYPPHFTSSQSHIAWGWGYPPHLTNQVDCTSAVKPNWLPLLNASTA